MPPVCCPAECRRPLPRSLASGSGKSLTTADSRTVQPDFCVSEHIAQLVFLASQDANAVFCRCRDKTQGTQVCGGTKAPRSKPVRVGIASHCASSISVLGPGTFLTCWVLTTPRGPRHTVQTLHRVPRVNATVIHCHLFKLLASFWLTSPGPGDPV